MAYKKNTWANGDTITAEKLNHMEDGIAEGGGGFVFIPVNENWKPLVTLGEIRRIYASGNIPIANYNYNGASQQGEGQHDYKFVDSFTDNGTTGGNIAFIKFGSTMYQSTSGSDDATWEYYD